MLERDVEVLAVQGEDALMVAADVLLDRVTNHRIHERLGDFESFGQRDLIALADEA